ncbi:MAG: hypothetical protein LBW77_02565 [Verrucomicrobiota bacterium]|nr:hypothetical protein [Verrucomicrobiota bacterium]
MKADGGVRIRDVHVPVDAPGQTETILEFILRLFQRPHDRAVSVFTAAPGNTQVMVVRECMPARKELTDQMIVQGILIVAVFWGPLSLGSFFSENNGFVADNGVKAQVFPSERSSLKTSYRTSDKSSFAWKWSAVFFCAGSNDGTLTK